MKQGTALRWGFLLMLIWGLLTASGALNGTPFDPDNSQPVDITSVK